MKKEEIISTGVMTLVSALVLIGFTVAWYSAASENATATGMEMSAKQVGSIKVALEQGGEDISVLVSNDVEKDEYVDIGLSELTNVGSEGNEEMAPGAFGKVTFYITPSYTSVQSCSIVPTLGIRQEAGDWYFGDTGAGDVETGDGTGDAGAGDGTGDTGTAEGDNTVVTIEELFEIAERHIDFFADEAMTQKIDLNTPFELTWTDEEGAVEKEAVIYWKWYYEYPFTDEETNTLDAAEQKLKIDEYDAEDAKLGGNLSSMKFHFTFSAQ